MKTFKKQPVFFISHGGGPCFWIDWGPTDPFRNLAGFFKKFISELPQSPSAFLVISAHWEENDFTLQTHPNPPMLYDYYGFPDHTYKLKFSGKTPQDLIPRISELFKNSNTVLKYDSERGYDHGLFVPFLLIDPNANIPILQLSMKNNLNPEDHFKLGEILSPLRDENIVIVGSGLSYHNLRKLVDEDGVSQDFDQWIWDTLQIQSDTNRKTELLKWENAPNARMAHPREDHLVPLFIAAGAAKSEKPERVYHEKMSNWKFWTSSFRFG